MKSLMEKVGNDIYNLRNNRGKLLIEGESFGVVVRVKEMLEFGESDTTEIGELCDDIMRAEMNGKN